MDNTLLNNNMLTEAQKKFFEELEELNEEMKDRGTGTSIIEKHTTYYYTRVYLKNEIDINVGDIVSIKHGNEVLDTIFVSYAKKGMEQEKINNFEDMLNYEPENNKRCLCLAIDVERVNDNSEDIQFIRTLFKWSKHYEYQILKKDDLVFSTKEIENILYFDIEF